MRLLVVFLAMPLLANLFADEAPGSPPLPLYWAIANNDALETWNLTDPSLTDPVVPEPEDLSWAILRGAGEAFDVLTYRGAPAGAILADGRNLLFAATERGRLDLFRKIAAAGAQLDQVDGRGYSLLHVGAASAQPIMVGYLLARGLAPVARSDLGITPLMSACEVGRIEAVRTLLDWGANPDDEDYLGRTVLWYAKRGGDSQTIELITGESSPPEVEASASSTDEALPPLQEQTLPGDPATPEPVSQP